MNKPALGAAPFMVSDEAQAQFTKTDELVNKLYQRIMLDADFKDSAACDRKSFKSFYDEEWRPYRDTWNDASWFADRADITNLAPLTARAQGFAVSCLPGYNLARDGQKGDSPAASGTDILQAASKVDEVAPGGSPPPGGGIKPASLVLLGGGLIVGGLLLRAAVIGVTDAAAALAALAASGKSRESKKKS